MANPEEQADKRWSRGDVFRPGEAPVAALSARHMGHFAPHDHDFVEIVLVQSGKAQHVTAAGTEVIQGGDVLVLRPGVWHGYDQVEGLLILNCCFGIELLSRELAWTLDDPVLGPLLFGPREKSGGVIHLCIPVSKRAACQRAWRDLEAMEHDGNRGGGAAIGRLLVYLDHLARAAGSGAKMAGPDIPPIVAQSIRRLEAEIAHSWRVEELAREAGVSSGHLTRQFTAAVGLAPLAYLSRCRAERAAGLLLRSSRKVGEIAREIGWEDPVYFARRFRKHYGMTAGAYRRRFGNREK